jgi:hypothetical protein
MNALVVTAKRLSIALHARDREGDLWGFMSVTAKNATERESALARFAVGQASFKHRHNQPDLFGGAAADASSLRSEYFRKSALNTL